MFCLKRRPSWKRLDFDYQEFLAAITYMFIQKRRS